MYQSKVIVKLKHDKGTTKISVWATSLQEAIDKVIESEKAPLNSVIYAKVSPLSISDIKYLSKEKAPYFFSRSTMRFFNQKMRDFSVTRYGNEKFYISAPSESPEHKTKRIFNPFTRELEFID